VIKDTITYSGADGHVCFVPLAWPPHGASMLADDLSRRKRPPANCMDWVDYQSSNDRERDRPKEEQRGAFWQNEPNSLNIFEVVLHRERRRAWGEAPKIRSSEGRLLCSMEGRRCVRRSPGRSRALIIGGAHHDTKSRAPSRNFADDAELAIRRALEEAGAGPRRDAGLRVFLILTKLPSSVQSSGGASPTKGRPVYQSISQLGFPADNALTRISNFGDGT